MEFEIQLRQLSVEYHLRNWMGVEHRGKEIFICIHTYEYLKSNIQC